MPGYFRALPGQPGAASASRVLYGAQVHAALAALAALPPGSGRFLLAPGLTGGPWLVGIGTVECLVPAGDGAVPWDRLLAPAPLGRVVVLGYELGRSLLRSPAKAREDLALPRAVALRIDAALALDPVTGARTALGDPAFLRLEAPVPILRSGPHRQAVSSLSRCGHGDAVQLLQRYLLAGDAYQANLTARLTAPLHGPPEALLAALLGDLSPRCAALVELPGGAVVVSASPETLLTFDAESGVASSFPIKGTRRRGQDPLEEGALAAELASDPKELAEHVMIVDLVRNDLGKVAATGTVEVAQLCAPLVLPGLLHLVSEVRAELAAAHGLPALVAALFPAGSITGAPKLRAMELIDELEPVARGPYCGAIGLVRPDGSAALSVAIRTAVVQDGLAHYGAGGGITVGSVAGREWEELLLKAGPFLISVGAAPPS